MNTCDCELCAWQDVHLKFYATELLVHQVSWEVMRGQQAALAAAIAAGAAPEMGVYVGIQQMEYSGLSAPHLATIGPYSATGGPFSVAAGRLSFTYGLKGTRLTLTHLSVHVTG